MTQAAVEFHTGLSQPVGHACALLRRLQSGAPQTVLVTLPAAQLPELDRALWVQLERDFLAHGVVRSAAGAVAVMPASMAARTPVWLSDTVDGVPVRSHAVWINIGLDVEPAGLSAAAPFVIELVGDDPAAVEAGRERWRAYRQLGCAAEHLPGGRRAAGG